LSVISQTMRTRLICAEGVFEVEPSTGEVTQVDAPQQGEVIWARRWHPQGALPNDVYYVVALGESAQLSLWREGREEGLSVAEGVALPSVTGLMDPADRLLPFTPPQADRGWPARVTTAGALEVWSPLGGWTPTLSTRWPLTASISPFRPLALSVGYTEDPRVVGDSFLQRVTIFTHHLGEGANFWGQPFKVSLSKDSFAGAHPAQFDDLGARPNVFSLVGSGLEMVTMGCEE
jgi:hypothetical protein